MTKSRMGGLALFALVAGSAHAAEPVTAERIIDNYRRTFPTIGEIDCPPAVGSEVVVCGRRDQADRHRLPLPTEEPGRRMRGEPPPATDLATIDADQKCISMRGCPKANSPIIPMIMFVIKVAKAVIEPDR